MGMEGPHKATPILRNHRKRSDSMLHTQVVLRDCTLKGLGWPYVVYVFCIFLQLYMSGF